MLCSWDAEEYGLLGSVEYVEVRYWQMVSTACLPVILSKHLLSHCYSNILDRNTVSCLNPY